MSNKEPDVSVSGSITIFGKTYSLAKAGWWAVGIIAAIGIAVIIIIRSL